MGEPPLQATQRLYFLDWLRIIAFAVLILYHVGMVYVMWPFHVKSPNATAALHPWMQLSAPWRMSLLFLLSGAATGTMLKGGASWQLWQSRTGFLLLPLLCGVVLLVPPQSYVEVQQKYAYTGSYADFLALYFTGYKGFCSGTNCLILPTWNHLWFLPYLWLYTTLLIGAVAGFPRLISRCAPVFEKVLSGPLLLLLPASVLLALRLTLLDRFPVTYALLDDVYSHAVYGSMFVAGVCLAARPAMWRRLAAARWWDLLLALVCWAERAGFLGLAGSLGLAPRSVAQPAVLAVFQWCAIVAAVGFAVQHLNRDHPWRATLTEAVFPVYMLHQTVLIVAFALLFALHIEPGLEALLLIALTFVISSLGYLVLRRFKALRPWFGLRNRSSARPQPPKPPATASQT
jgi:glucans biosynthesis protein C